MAGMIETAIRSTVTKSIGVVAEFNRKRLDTDIDHPFLTGIHQPMAEEVTLEDLPVTGTIPAILDGRYLRIGPNPVAPDPAGYHWFTGDGMVHGVAIREGKALWYRNRWIRSRRAADGLGEPPAPGPRHGGFDTVNTNILAIAGRTFALVEAGSYPVELSDTLDEQTYNPFDDTLTGSFTAHPHRDPLTGEQHAIAYEATDPETIRHVVLSPEGLVVREEPIKVKHGPSIHDCAITARFAVILDLPVTFSMKSLIAGHSFPYRWNPDHQARIGLLPRDGRGDETIWVDVDPSYIFHVANAFDLPDGRVVMDAVVYDTMFADSTVGPDAMSRGLERWTIDPVAGTVERRTIDATPQEFPRPDERRFGQPYRYAYTLGLPAKDDSFIGETFILKHDLETGTREVHDFGTGRYPGEFVFVPAREDAAEDEGWVIGLVVDLPRQTTDLVILDARSFAGEPVASIHLPHRVPPGFHGNWLAA
ncbi:carotenoid oxygenase [Sphingomonas sp. So64.6b]|uniref:8'-apo-carotenoid 13,14-cleaving dioxygenase n=1 Tax=Sphingomonas sp. So64.6b TaxID=2997354 RepID=UPI00160006FF|nr:carotenoid oxygenase family protein [Sphingomonas sp. So64.6b]QNA85565.1 carotenoid oxygenase [Sphingomonas sp. So64.6b]